MCKKKRKYCIKCGNLIFNRQFHAIYCLDCWKVRYVELMKSNYKKQYEKIKKKRQLQRKSKRGNLEC